MYVELVEILGKIETNNNIIIGNAILFNIIDNEYAFNCILYVNETNDPFVVLHDTEDETYNNQLILIEILKKYNLTDLKQL